jgi:hypothetical protein
MHAGFHQFFDFSSIDAADFFAIGGCTRACGDADIALEAELDRAIVFALF